MKREIPGLWLGSVYIETCFKFYATFLLTELYLLLCCCWPRNALCLCNRGTIFIDHLNGTVVVQRCSRQRSTRINGHNITRIAHVFHTHMQSLHTHAITLLSFENKLVCLEKGIACLRYATRILCPFLSQNQLLGC